MQRYDTIVVGVDFTDPSRNALREAIRLASPDGHVHVVHVVESVAVDELRTVLEAAGESEQLIIAEAEVRLGEMVNGLRPASGGPTIHIDVVTGNPAPTLLERTQHYCAGLLVLARNSTSDPAGGAGTCAVSCVRHAAADVLLVRESHEGLYRRIMACVDFSAHSHGAIERAARLAERDGAELHLVHAFRPPWEVVPFAAVPMAASGDYQTEHMQMLEGQLQQVNRRLAEQYPQVSVQMHLEPAGSVGSTLVATADSLDVDLAVLGTHGRGRIGRLLLGSTAERVIRSAACSVITVRLVEQEPVPDDG